MKDKSQANMASKGGKARAASLTPAERQQISKKAIQSRWAKAGKAVIAPEGSEPAATEMPYSMFRGHLSIGPLTVEAHVLSDLRRVLTQREFVRVLTAGDDRPGRDSGNLARYLESNPLINNDLVLGQTVKFRIPKTQFVAHGFEGTLIVDVCTKYLEASEQGKLHPSSESIAKQAGIVIRACAKVGIIALIDEATGYQKIRAKHALQLKLQAFIADEMGEWAKLFPDEFWLQLARLEGVGYSPSHRPIRWGRYVMMFVYDAIDKDVGKMLREKNPDPQHLQNHHQWMTQFGRDKVNNHLQRVIGIMQTCNDMEEFRQKFGYIFKIDPWQLTWDEWLRPVSS